MGTLIDSIKQAAKQNGTKIQSTEARDLEQILNKTFYLPKDIEKETNFIKQVMTRGLESQERIGLHASAMLVGEKEFCIRAQVLSLIYKQLQGENVAPPLKRIFVEGDAIHEKWQRLFIRAGYATANDCDYTRYNNRYMLSYTPDIIANIPEWYKGDFVVEIKSMNTHQFKKMVADGKRHPSAWKQCQWYMHLTGIPKGIVLNEDKNTQDIYIEVYDYDPKLVAPFAERAELIRYFYKRVHSHGRMAKRPVDATSHDCKRCTKCNMCPACWGVGMGKILLEEEPF